MKTALKREALSSTLGMVLLIWGCPKRQTPPRVVYVPSPPSATTTASAGPSETLVIEEPPPPEEPEVVAPEIPAPQPPPPRRRAVRTSSLEPAEATAEPAEPPSAEVPALQPRESREEGAALRQQILDLHQNVQQRIARLNPGRLSGTDRKTLEDAQVFLEQSAKALEQGDLQRALTLARKASLLVSVVEQ